MASIRLAFDSSAGNKTHIVPQCFDSKNVDNATRFTLANYDAKDGGIPINFGLNCLGWMVSKLSLCMLQYFAPVFEFLIVLLCLFEFSVYLAGMTTKSGRFSGPNISLCVPLYVIFLGSD